MPSIRYKGPHSAVEVPSLDNAVVALGEAIDVTDEQAAGFIEQDSWELVPPSAPTSAPTKTSTTDQPKDGS